MGISLVRGVVIDMTLRWYKFQVVKDSLLALATEDATNIPASYQPGKVQIAQKKHLLSLKPDVRELFQCLGIYPSSHCGYGPNFTV